MIEAFLAILILIPALLGTAELIHALRLAVLAPKEHRDVISVIILEPEYAEQQLRYAIERADWTGNNRIAAVTDRLTDGGAELKKLFVRDDVIFCTADALAEFAA